MKEFNFQDPTYKTDFCTCRGGTVLYLPQKPVGNQYLKVLRILKPCEILVPLEILHSLRSTRYVQLKIFPAPIHKIGFSIDDPATICNFPEKLAQNKYISVGS